MNRAAWTIAGACCLDALIGDPRWLPHPVRLIGAAAALGDRCLNRDGGGSRAAGAALALAVIGIAASAGVAVRRSFFWSIVLGSSTLAARDLLAEAAVVARALECGELVSARERVARIVGRDTADLSRSGVARAAVETLGESACDGIVAPLFWIAVGGLPAALAFKAASTLDSMIGHREARYLRFGCVAARIDDVLNFVPARITAALIGVSAGVPLRVARITLRDAPRHASPNAGWPETALAAVLGVRLGGTNAYGGVALDGAILNADGRPPESHDIREAMRVVRRLTLLAQAAAIAARAWAARS